MIISLIILAYAFSIYIVTMALNLRFDIYPDEALSLALVWPITLFAYMAWYVYRYTLYFPLSYFHQWLIDILTPRRKR